jgi:uncharacterized protein (UPF0218 family)
MRMDYNLKFPRKIRKKVKPLGKLITGEREKTISQVENMFRELASKSSESLFKFYIVGDVVTKDFLANDYLKKFVKICIIDEKTKRGKIEINFEHFFEKISEFKNPEGTIQKGIWSLLEDCVKSERKILIKITEGEEDLLAIPLLLTLSSHSKAENYVFYGQPPITDSEPIIPEGIVIVKVTEQVQDVLNEYVKLMEKF